MEACPVVAKRVVKHYRAIGAGGHAKEQVDALEFAAREFGRRIRPIRGGRVGGLLGAVRNTVAAHHGGKGAVGMTPLIAWTHEHASKAGQPMAPEHQELMQAVWDLARALTDFGHAIQEAL